jgi:hypothetical protein
LFHFSFKPKTAQEKSISAKAVGLPGERGGTPSP